MATIRPRKNEHGQIVSYQAIIRRQGVPPQSKSFKRRADAVAWAHIIESEIDRGEFVDRTEAERTLFADALKKYEHEVTPRKKGAKQEGERLRYWQRHRLAKYALSKLRPSDFGDWRDDELRAGKSPNTVRNHLTILSHFFNHARREWGIPIRNPIADLWRPKPRRRTRRYKADEETRLHAAAPAIHPLLLAAIVVLTESAMRRSELVGMTRDHLNLGNRTYFLPDPKNSEPRHVPLSTAALRAIESLPRRLDGRIWPWEKPGSLSHLFRDACKLAGIDDFHLHDLRHEATSRLARVYSVHELAKVRGDKTLNELMTYYHPTGDELAARLADSEIAALAPPTTHRR